MSRLKDYFKGLLQYVDLSNHRWHLGEYYLDRTRVSEAVDALEIINTKNVDIAALKLAANVDEYNNWGDPIPLTLDDFHLIRRVLNYV